MIALINLVHIIVCVGLIVIVLLQADKGEGLSGAFGGGASSTIFGERGGGDFMTRLTTGMAVVFMITSLLLCLPRWASKPVNIDITSPVPIETSIPGPAPMMPMGEAIPAPTGGDIPVAPGSGN
jgi:preprotein translocase subunit SecG